MFNIIKSVISAGYFELKDLLAKIDTLWLQGSLTDAARLELIELARGKADPANSFAPIQAQIDALADRVKALEAAAKPTEPDTPAAEWPDYIQPTGSHDAYHTGDKVTHNGTRYVCTAPEGAAVVWAPDVYPAYWQAVTD